MNSSTLTRRDFLKRIGVGATGAVAAGLLVGVPHGVEASEEASEEAWGTLIDLSRCIGCNSCALACKKVNDRPNVDVVPHALDSDAYTFVDVKVLPTPDGEFNTWYVKRQCMQCNHPACASACTVGALRKTPEGPVVYDSGKCIGCRYCQYACPFSVPTYEWENPLGLIHKCQFCAQRLAKDEKPACVGACPSGALRFGKRQELLQQAHAEIATNPGRYVDHVYGEHEVGGTSMLYLAPAPFEQLGFPELGSEPNPRYAEAVMVKTPFIALTVATVATGLSWVLKRRGDASEHEGIETHHTRESK